MDSSSWQYCQFAIPYVPGLLGGGISRHFGPWERLRFISVDSKPEKVPDNIWYDEIPSTYIVCSSQCPQIQYSRHKTSNPIANQASLPIKKLIYSNDLLHAKPMIQSILSTYAHHPTATKRRCNPFRLNFLLSPVLMIMLSSPEIHTRYTPLHNLACRVKQQRLYRIRRRRNPNPLPRRIIMIPRRSFVDRELRRRSRHRINNQPPRK